MYFKLLPKELFELLISFFTKYEEYLVLKEVFGYEVKNYIKCIEELDDASLFPKIEKIKKIEVNTEVDITKLNLLKNLKDVYIILNSWKMYYYLDNLFRQELNLRVKILKDDSLYNVLAKEGNVVHLYCVLMSWIFKCHKIGIRELYLYSKIKNSYTLLPTIVFDIIHIMFGDSDSVVHGLVSYEMHICETLRDIDSTNVRSKKVTIDCKDRKTIDVISSVISESNNIYNFEEIECIFNRTNLQKIVDKFPKVKKFSVKYDDGEKFEVLKGRQIVWM